MNPMISYVLVKRHAGSLRVKARLVIDALPEQFRPFLLPFLERLDWCLMLERPLRDAMVIDLDVIAQRRFQFGS